MKKLILFLLTVLPLGAMAQKFGHFNSAEIIPMMAEYTQAQTEMEQMSKQFEDDLKLMYDEIQKKAQELEQQQGALPEAIKQRRQQEVQDLYQRFQQQQQDAQEAVQKANQEKMGAVMQKVTTAVKKIGEEGQYVYIMDTSAGIPYISATLSTDITAQLKAALGIK